MHSISYQSYRPTRRTGSRTLTKREFLFTDLILRFLDACGSTTPGVPNTMIKTLKLFKFFLIFHNVYKISKLLLLRIPRDPRLHSPENRELGPLGENPSDKLLE